MWKLLILGIVIAIIIYAAFWYFGSKAIYKDYEVDYARLVNMVRTYKVTNHNKAIIKQRFGQIRLYKCRDKEQLDVLWREFHKRFAI
jgi:hypothetical protein